MKKSEEIIAVESSALEDGDEKLFQFFQEIQKDSLKTLEEAGRQIISLSTTLLGLFFGVLAFASSPAYLAFHEIKFLGAFSAGALLAGLFFALDVVMPRMIQIPQSDLTEMRATLEKLYRRKSRSLEWAQIAFGCGTLFFVGMILVLLFRL